MSSFNLPLLPEASLGVVPAAATAPSHLATRGCFLPVFQTDLSCEASGGGTRGFGESHGSSHGCHAHRRHKRKHKREDEGEDSDECYPPKRFLSEEAMTACLQQLNLTSTPGPASGLGNIRSNQLNMPSHVLSNELSIRTVGACSGSLEQRNTCNSSSSSSSMEGYERKLASVPPTSSKISCNSSNSSGAGGGRSSLTCLSHLPPGVQIQITPVTPTSIAPTRHHHQQPKHPSRPCPSSLRHPSGKNWDAILEDISSDSSDGMETPERPTVWLAPEIINGFASYKKDQMLPQPILEEINKKGMELVPWVGPERYLLNTQSQNEDVQEMKDIQPEEPEESREQSNGGCSPESIEEDKLWDFDELEMEA